LCFFIAPCANPGGTTAAFGFSFPSCFFPQYYIWLLLQPIAISFSAFTRLSDQKMESTLSSSRAARSKPSLVLVYGRSFLRGWLEKGLRRHFNLRIFARAEEALDYARSAAGIDILVSELNLGSSPLGGCNVAREVKARFPESLIFIFRGGGADDHRLGILGALSRVTLLDKPFGALFLSRRIRSVLRSLEPL
jgi:hypothetical protein